jgi:acyl-CoA hydrolase
MTDIHDNPEALVDLALERVGRDLRVGAPLGLGKPVQLLNAFYRRAAADPTISLQIFTALSLEVPTPSTQIEEALAGPIFERLFGDYEELDYMAPLRRGALPPNIRASELYFKAGAMKGVASAQQGYISSNYTHIARDMCAAGVNVLCQMIAFRDDADGLRLSLSSNPDTATDLLEMLERERPGSYVALGQLHPEMPFMEHDAEVRPALFDALLRSEACNRRLFAVPNAAVPESDYAAALHASSLVPDGGTLQIGIGALGDAIAHALIVRHRDNDAYASLLARMAVDIADPLRHAEPFDRGLYVSTEMFVNGMLHLIEEGVVKRRVYDDLALQEGLNSGAVTETVDARLHEYAREHGLMPRVLDAATLARLQHFGIIGERVSLDGDTLVIDGRELENDTHDAQTAAALLASAEGRDLRNGRVLHGGFFLGPADFYERLRGLDSAQQERLCMTSVLRTNQLLQDPPLYAAQRRNARFINTGMMVSLAGAVTSDGLENGTVVSGVGGQYNFVAMAHDLPGARSVLCIRATRQGKDGVVSNVVPFHGHVTIPRHLRDIVVTEYGVADLRGQSDAEVAKRLIAVADSRFQEELLAFAQREGKVEASFELPPLWRHNTPGRIAEELGEARRTGLLPDYPFGTELTEQERLLGASLRRIKALSEEPGHFIARAFRAILHHPDPDAARPYLERIHLEHPHTSREFLVQQLLLLDLEERGLLKVS